MSFFSSLSGLWGKKGQKIAPAEKPVKQKIKISPRISEELLLQAKAKAQEIILEAKEEAFKIKKQANDKYEEIRQKALQIQSQQQEKLANIERQQGALEEKSKFLDSERARLLQIKKEINQIKEKEIKKLEKISSLTKDEAKNLILSAWEKKLKTEISMMIKEAEDEMMQTSEEKAKEILVSAMQRGATDYVPEYTVSVVKLKDEDMKGRIIGKEGRNIRTFEKVTGVDTDLDEEGVIRLSSFDSIRREVARVALERLLADGRIQPSRIEEIVDKTRKDIDRIIQKSGEDLCYKLRVFNLPRDVVNMLGRFRYRSSYGQNMIAHTLEETKIGVALANEIGANVNVVRLGCLLHDIGKVITEEEGSHVKVGVDFLKKYNIPKEVIDCVAQHHGDEDFSSIESNLVYIADAISGSRPGARYEDYEEYLARLKNLEEIAKSFEGVVDAYAIQAGREIRVIIDPEKKNDIATKKLAIDIRDKIKKKTTVPGQIKVTVIREVRQTETT